MYPFCPPSSTRAQRFLRGLTLLLILITMCLQFEAAHAQAHYARPYTGGGPNNVPSSQGNTISAVYLVDPVSGNPVTPAGTGSVPTGISVNGTVNTTSVTLLTAGQIPHWVATQNTDTNGTLYVSYNTPATTTNSFAIAPNTTLVIPSGTTNALYAIGSATNVTYDIIGY